MSRQFLKMKYHPAKKEVSFTHVIAGKEKPIKSGSILCNYMNEYGKFILQYHGNKFFDDIVETFDGEESVHIKVVTTKNDYEDFLQMIEYYNESSDVKITAELLAELPDMNETYRVVKEHGEKSIKKLNEHKNNFSNLPIGKAIVKEYVDMFTEDVQKEVYNISDKINKMSDNAINLCFAGVYSSGKSALINSIIGYKILPEAINSETARIFKIQSPGKGEIVRIVFGINSDYVELLWNDNNKILEFIAGPAENDTCKAIKDAINANKAELQHSQIYDILKILNSKDDVNAEIKVYFPIPLDNDKCKFTIYDTPGTDSNFGEHQMVLQDALSKQNHSILIFVAVSDRMEGSGNNVLLSYIQGTENKDKTSIDLSRSLFVINKADSIEIDTRKILQTQTIKNKDDENFSVKLSDKKLFFVSSLHAYRAKAIANKIATPSEQNKFKSYYKIINSPEDGRYYQQNRIATSEYATQKLIEKSDNELNIAIKNKDRKKIFHVCSGLYSLETEIIAYGEKYAAAVRAFAIIDSVDKALSTMNKNVRLLEQKNQMDIEIINLEIRELQQAINKSIKDAYDKHNILENDGSLPKNLLIKLRLNMDFLADEIVNPIMGFIDGLLKEKFFGGVSFNNAHKNEIQRRITTVLYDYRQEFLEQRQLVLEQSRDSFIRAVKKAIEENGKISEEAKNYILKINPPKYKTTINITGFQNIYDNCKRIDKFLWLKSENIDKTAFCEQTKIKLMDICSAITDSFTNDLRETLKSTLNSIESEFRQNKDKYSVLMQAMFADKKVMRQICDKITLAASDLKSFQKELNKIIWEIKDNE